MKIAAFELILWWYSPLLYWWSNKNPMEIRKCIGMNSWVNSVVCFHQDNQRARNSALWVQAERVRSFLVEKRPFKEDFITVFQYLKGGYKDNGGSHLHKEPQRPQRETGTNCTRRGFIFKYKRFFFSKNNHSLGKNSVGTQ